MRNIGSTALSFAAPNPGEFKTVTAQLRVTAASLARLLSITGSRSDFVLASADGSTSVRVGLTVSSVPEAQLVIGSRVVIDWADWTLTHGVKRVTLSRMELRLLMALMEFAPKPAPRERIAKRLWPAEDPDDRQEALSVWILALRRRLIALGLPKAIRTVRGRGYCLDL